jgi:hypothetical protein
MIADQLHETETYEEAVDLGLRYAEKRAVHAQHVADLATDLTL